MSNQSEHEYTPAPTPAQPETSGNDANWIIWLVIGVAVIALFVAVASQPSNPSSGPEQRHYTPTYPGSHMDED